MSVATGAPRLNWAEIVDQAAAIVSSYSTRVTLRQLFYRLVAAEVLPNTSGPVVTGLTFAELPPASAADRLEQLAQRPLAPRRELLLELAERLRALERAQAAARENQRLVREARAV